MTSCMDAGKSGDASPSKSCARRRREQALRATAKHVAWLTQLVQASRSHHTSAGPQSSHSSAPTVAPPTAEEFNEIQQKLVKLERAFSALELLVGRLCHNWSEPFVVKVEEKHHEGMVAPPAAAQSGDHLVRPPEPTKPVLVEKTCAEKEAQLHETPGLSSSSAPPPPPTTADGMAGLVENRVRNAKELFLVQGVAKFYEQRIGNIEVWDSRVHSEELHDALGSDLFFKLCQYVEGLRPQSESSDPDDNSLKAPMARKKKTKKPQTQSQSWSSRSWSSSGWRW